MSLKEKSKFIYEKKEAEMTVAQLTALILQGLYSNLINSSH